MEAALILLGLFVLVTLMMPWVHAVSIHALQSEVRALKTQLRELRIVASTQKEPTPPTVSEQKQTAVPSERPISKHIPYSYDDRSIVKEANAEPSYTFEVPEEDLAEEVTSLGERYFDNPPHQRAKLTEKSSGGFEQNFGAKLPVWIGSIALIFAAFYLIKYSMDSGWLDPRARLVISSLFGGGLLLAGQWAFKRQHIANAERIAQGLVGSGLVILYGCLYASTNFYDFIPTGLAFAGMAGVTATAAILSLRHGQPIAAFGVIGGLLTPALIGSDAPNELALFGYLFVLLAGMQIMLAWRGWWTLSIVTVLGLLIWTGLWATSPSALISPHIGILFMIATCAVILTSTFRVTTDIHVQSTTIHSLNIIALASAALLILSFALRIELSLFDWFLFSLLGLATLGLSYIRPDVYKKALQTKIALTMVLFYFWAGDVTTQHAMIITAMIAGLYVVIPTILMRRDSDPRLWAGTQFLVALSLYLTCYFQVNFPTALQDSPIPFWGTISLCLASLAVYQAGEIHKGYFADDGIRDRLLAIYALAATSFISAGLAIELPFSYLPIAFAAQIVATIWIYQHSEIDFLKSIITILAIIFIGLNFEQVHLFSLLCIQSIFNDPISRGVANQLILNAPLVKLGIPALFMMLGVWLYSRLDEADSRLTHLLFSIVVLLVTCAGYYMVRHVFHGADSNIFTKQAGFLERASITLTLAAAGIGLLKSSWRDGLKFAYPWGMALFHLAMARIAFYDLVLLNPYYASGQAVGAWPLLNGITLIYGLGAVLATWAVYTREWGEYADNTRNAYKALGFTLLFAFASLTVRHQFHGTILADGRTSDAEFYCYSIAWLLCGLALLAYGIWKENRTARIASLGFMLLTVGKVFLMDAAQLDGLYRVASFLGLGFSLIGLSYFYTRYVFKRGS